MSTANSNRLGVSARSIVRGLREIGVFVGECAAAVLELCLGQWPSTRGPRRRKPTAPDDGMGPLEKSSSYPLED